MQTVQKLKLQPKHITVHNLWLLNQNGKGSGSASSNCCLYKKSLWLCLTELCVFLIRFSSFNCMISWKTVFLTAVVINMEL